MNLNNMKTGMKLGWVWISPVAFYGKRVMTNQYLNVTDNAQDRSRMRPCLF